MSFLIGLSSVRPSGTAMVYLQVGELTNETLFCLDRSLRAVVQTNPRAEWVDFANSLAHEGFISIDGAGDRAVFIHSRPWDEHLVNYGQSFFVSFPEDAPYELAGSLMLASPYPQFYGGVSADYLQKGGVVLIDRNHDPVYPDDLAWANEHHQERRAIGPVRVVSDQFCSLEQAAAAEQALKITGYELDTVEA